MKIEKDGAKYHVHDGLGHRLSTHNSHEAAMSAVESAHSKGSAEDGPGAGSEHGERVEPYHGGYTAGAGGDKADVPAGSQSEDED